MDFAAILVAILGVFFLITLTFVLTKEAIQSRFEQEAVDNGHALFDQKTKEFTWLKPPRQNNDQD